MEYIVLWTFFGFLLGGVPFSPLLVRLALNEDVRIFGDGNPGAMNAWKAGGWQLGLLASMLDVGKGMLPVVLARGYGLAGEEMIPVALAPVFGHAFSPFLKFRGGKALAATGGVWLALIGIEAPLAFAMFSLPALALQMEHAWTGVAGVGGLLTYSLIYHRSSHFIPIAAVNLLVVIWTHRRELQQPIRLRPWVENMIARRVS